MNNNVERVNTLEGVVFTNVGEHEVPVYKRVYDKDLDKSIVKKVDKFDLFNFIQASKNTTDLALLEKRYIELGEIPAVDPSLTNVDQTLYPNNIHEVYAMANDVNSNFNSLPESIRNIFGSADAYMSALLNGTYQATILNYINSLDASSQQQSESNEGGN